MRVAISLALLVGAAVAVTVLAWPTHPVDSISCEIARTTGIEPELDIERCERALESSGWRNVFIHRQITLINADQPGLRFAQMSTEFRDKIERRYAEYDMRVLGHAGLLWAILGLILLASAALWRRKRIWRSRLQRVHFRYGNRR